jgi:PE family
MSYVIAAPDMMTAAAAELATIGSTLDEAHSAAAPATLAVAPPAADEVSMAIATIFSGHAQEYQAVARQAAASQRQFVQNLSTSATAYTGIEDAIVSLLQGLDTGVRSLELGYASQVTKFIANSGSWINLIPGPLRTFVVGIPFLSIFVFAVPLAIVSAIIQATIAVVGG